MGRVLWHRKFRTLPPATHKVVLTSHSKRYNNAFSKNAVQSKSEFNTAKVRHAISGVQRKSGGGRSFAA